MKILIIHASAGAGHRKAAEALYDGFKDTTSHDVTLVDALDYTSPFYKRGYGGVYTFLVSKIPWMWAVMFYSIDIPLFVPLVRMIRRVQNALNAKSLHTYLIGQKFDYIISTHFFPNEVSSHLKRTGKIKSEIISVITDFDVHSIWLSEGIGHYCVASAWTRNKLIELGVDEGNVFVTGIPTHSKFSLVRVQKELRRKINIAEDAFTVLIATGSFGIGPIEQILEALKGFQVIVVCGHNKKLYGRLKPKANGLVHICGLVDNMDELMAASNIMVTKPGGLSISEALVSQLPMIFFNAIPGQEAHNIKVLKQHNVGISGCSITEIASVIGMLKDSPEKYMTAVKNTEILAQPSAVKNVISLIS